MDGLADRVALVTGVARGDVTEPESVRHAISTAHDVAGPISLLVNNAGIVQRGNFREQPVDGWERVLRTNLTGALIVVRELAEQPDAAIVSITSVNGWIGGSGMASYSAAKAGLQALNRVMALEMAAPRTSG